MKRSRFRDRVERPSIRARWRARRDERGAGLIEFALISPIFFLIIFGGIEMTLMFQTNLAIQDLSRNGARIASIARDADGTGGTTHADVQIMTEIESRVRSVNGKIEKIIIYRADTLSSPVPTDCHIPGTTGKDGECNVYHTDWKDFLDGTKTAPTTTGYTPASRQQWENIGVYIEYRYDFVTGFIENTTLRATTVEVVELDL